MKIKMILFCISLFVFTQVIQAQDEVLFTVGDTPVQVSEFNYIYSKTNGAEADYSKKSVEEYLDLYVKFKLKVQKAKEMKIDTIKALKAELAGYQKQLSDSYLIDKEVKEKLIKEAYERKKEDVNISHIMIPFRGDTLPAFEKITKVKELLDSGRTFEEMATLHSLDVYTNKKEGKIGWINATLPNGFYHFESAAYETPVGKYSNIVKTQGGYHIVKVNEKRPAKGLIEVAHIVVRADKKNQSKDPKAIIDDIHKQLVDGGDFDQLARALSEDKKSKLKGGLLDYFGINVHEKSFEDAAFALAKDGDFSTPIQTKGGWHIIKRISKPTFGTFEEEKNRLQNNLKNDSRIQEANLAMIKKIKKENNFTINNKTLDTFIASLGDDFKSNKWRAPKKSKETLFSFGQSNFLLGEFTDYLLRSSRQRLTMSRTHSNEQIVKKLLDDYSDKKALDLEKSQLSEKYPDFRSLMREYEEGILLFEVTKMLIWDKAAQDSIGLQKFYNNNSDNYLWGERGTVSVYTINSQSEKILKKARKLAAKKDASVVLKKINKMGNLMTVNSKEVEKGKSKMEDLEAITWKKGAMTANVINSDNSVSFIKIEKMLPRQKKTLKEARGYVIADYQDYLEAQWIEQLRKEYQVNIDKKVLNSIIK